MVGNEVPLACGLPTDLWVMGANGALASKWQSINVEWEKVTSVRGMLSSKSAALHLLMRCKELSLDGIEVLFRRVG